MENEVTLNEAMHAAWALLMLYGLPTDDRKGNAGQPIFTRIGLEVGSWAVRAFVVASLLFVSVLIIALLFGSIGLMFWLINYVAPFVHTHA